MSRKGLLCLGWAGLADEDGAEDNEERGEYPRPRTPDLVLLVGVVGEKVGWICVRYIRGCRIGIFKKCFT